MKHKAKLKKILIYLIPCVVIFFRFLPFFLSNKTLVFGDNYSLMVPGKIFTANWIKQGMLPLWNPHLFSGIPWIADINQSVIYPSTLLFIFLSADKALVWTVILHLLLTYTGMFLLVKKITNKSYQAVLAGCLWMLSTQISGSINNLSTIQSLTWLPWVVLFGLSVHKRTKTKFFFALVICLQFMGGYPQHVIYSILTAVAFSAFYSLRTHKWKKWLIHWLITGLLTVLSSTFIWLPFVEMLLNSTRVLQSSSQAMAGSLHPAMLVKPFLMYFFDKSTAGYKWGPAWSGQPNVVFYIGWLGLILLTRVLFKKKEFKKNDLFFLIIMITTLIISFGIYLPGFALVQKIVPLLKFGRYPSMALIVSNFTIIIWFITLLERNKLKPKEYRILKIFGKLTVIFALLFYLLINTNFPLLWNTLDGLVGHRLSLGVFHNLARDSVIARHLIENLLVVSALFLLSLFFLYRNKKWMFTLVVIFDLLYCTQSMFFFAPSDVYEQNFNKTIVQDAYEGNNVDYQHRWLIRNSNMPYTDYGMYWEAMVVRSPFSDSFIDEKELQEYETLKRLQHGLTPDWNLTYRTSIVNGYTTLLPKNYADLWQVSKEARINFVDTINVSNPLLNQWSVKYYLVDKSFEIKEDLSNLRKIADKDSWTLYELNALPRFRFEDDLAVEFLDFKENPNMIELEFNSDGNKQLVIADRFDKDWKAVVNSEEIEIENYQGMKRISIVNGKNTVRLVYKPKLFYIGIIISLLSATLSLFLKKLKI